MNKKTILGLLLITVVALGGIPGVLGLPGYLSGFETQYPSAVGSRIDNCGLCHINPAGGGPRNPFGTDFENQSIHSSNPGQALVNIESLDSDGDTFTNIEEINAKTFPGNASDHPAQLLPPPSTPSAPAIVSSSPTSPVTDNVGAARTFNVDVNQTVDINWYINGTPVQTNSSVTGASYTNNSAILGTWNVSAVAANANGTVTQEWNWIVTESSLQPPVSGQTVNVTFVVTDNETGLPVDGAKVSMNGTRIKTDNTGTAVFTGIVPGDYKYKVRAEDYQKTVGNISVTGDTTVTVKLVSATEGDGHMEDGAHENVHWLKDTSVKCTAGILNNENAGQDK